jgi:hypothetical protein
MNDDVAQWIFRIALEQSTADWPTEGGRSEWHFDDDSLSYPSFDDVTDVELAEMGEKTFLHLWRRQLDVEEGTTVVVFHGEQTARRTRQMSRARYNPPSKAHPAEYSSEEIELHFTLAVPMHDIMAESYLHYERV